MKTLKISMLLALFVGAFTACSDEVEEAALPNEDVAEVMAASLAKNTGGLAAAVDGAADVSASPAKTTAECGVPDERSYERSFDGAYASGDYLFEYSFLLECDAASNPVSMQMEHSYQGEFTGVRLSSSNSGSAEWELIGFGDASNTLVFSGEYDRSGSFESYVRNRNQGSSQITLSFDTLNVDKSTREIVSGSATLRASGEVSGKGSYSKEATVTFNGDGTATLNLSGDAYTVNLTTGEVS